MKDRRTLLCSILAGLLVASSPSPIAQARSPRVAASGGWRPLPRPSMPKGAIKGFSPPSEMVGSPIPARGSFPRAFSRSMDWADLGNGTKIRAVPPTRDGLGVPGQNPAMPGTLNPLALTPLSLNPADPSEVFTPPPTSFQLQQPPLPPGSSPIATGVPPVTGALPQPLMPPGGAAAPNQSGTGSEGSLEGILRFTPAMNIQLSNLDFRDIGVADALRSLASLINLNIMIMPNVTGQVNIVFNNIQMEEAFNTLMRGFKLKFDWQQNILRIFPEADAPISTKIYQLQQAEIADVASQVLQIMTEARRVTGFSPDPKSNSFMITDTVVVLDKIDRLLPQIDQKRRPADPSSLEYTEVFYLDYVDADNLTQPIAQVAPRVQVLSYSSNQAAMAGAAGAAGANAGRKDMMIITARQATLDQIRELVEKLDVAPIQVTIDAHIYEINLNEEERLGINWQKSIPLPGTTENIFNMQIAPETADAGGTGVFRYGSLTVNQFQALLAMLKTHSFAKVLSNPVITTLNNREANITVGQAIPYVSASTVNAQTGQVSNTVSQVNANITLLVTPSVTGNDEVFLNISPTITSVLGFTTLGGNSTPNLSNRSAQTQVIIRNNNTIVIGGMIKTDKSDTTSKVPLLGDLPGIGHLFRKKTTSETRTELIIFITPHIVRQHNANTDQAAGSGAGATTAPQPRISLQP